MSVNISCTVFVCIYHHAEVLRDRDGLIAGSIEAYHYGTAFTFHILCSCINSSLHKSKALSAQMHDGSVYGYLVRIEDWCEEVGVYVCNNNGKPFVDILAHDIEEILRLAGVEKLEIDAVVDVSKLVNI